jgi:exopolyphosphatase/guanosine-5'-triphosphate,3'-diphosphate pyrophosphatase
VVEKLPSRLARRGARRVAVVDIGSNSIRLVVYKSLSRSPVMLFNEKVMCGLGRGIAKTGRLNPDGVAMATLNLVRFRSLVDAMDVGDVEVVATAAVREASNGPDFIAEVERRTGFTVRILSGEEEAQLSALGLVASIPEADGMLGDLGGGSLELVDVSDGQVGRHVTLPIGPLRLIDSSEGSMRRGLTLIDAALGSVDWLDTLNGRSFYAVGGAWRSIARVMMDHESYPLHIIHHYSSPADRAASFLDIVSRMSKEQLKMMPNVSRRRVEMLPWAALILERIFDLAKPSELVFSASGLREGCLYDKLPKRVLKQDPLLSACAEVATERRFLLSDQELYGFIAPLVAAENAATKKLARAASLLSDIAWSEHPDYRAEQGYWRVLRLPIVGVTHSERAFLARAIASRYGASPDALVVQPASVLLDPDRLRLADQIGLGLRLAYTLSGGAPGVLAQSSLKLKGGFLSLSVPSDGSVVVGDAVQRRLDALARSLEAEPLVAPEEPIAAA